ncbi:sulfatase family protein [Niabella aurantiaca]|uniref:sulfatase family protein n=1 Tax=Niabella aurantiaca TaxID=379900 RepID=UPI0003A17670|nr:arylsulfatase [Niabella aurantiaca]
MIVQRCFLTGLMICLNLWYVSAQQRPNVILIYADDLGFGDLGCYGATHIQTPNTDALAEQGIRFTNAHSTSATCTPSRYALMTGVYPWREKGHNILPGDAALIVPVNRITLPKVFKQAGYQTGIVGKWHLGLGDQVEKNWNGRITPGPNETGFDYSFIFPATADRVPTVFMENGKVTGLSKKDTITVNYKRKIGDEPTGKENPELLKLRASHGHNNTIINGIGRIGFMTGGKKARWTDEEVGPTFLAKAQQFIDKNKHRPFFLYFALNNIHVPRMPATMFKGKSTMGYRGDAILEMDWIVGAIRKQLEQSGIAKNTIIIFSSDNGPVLDDGYADEAVEKVGTHRPAGPLRGWKTSIYEGGTRVPFIVYWPGKVKAGVSDALISQMDLLPSFAAYLKVRIPKGAASDAEDHILALTGKDPKGREQLVEEGYHNLAILKRGWKYIPASKNKAEQLFYLTRDISEARELSKEYPEKAAALRGALDAIKGNQ